MQEAAQKTASMAYAPKIVKTTTKQTMVQNAKGVRHNKEQKVEDLTPGGTGDITVVSSTNKVFTLERALEEFKIFYQKKRK